MILPCGVFRPSAEGCNGHARGTIRARVRHVAQRRLAAMKLEGSYEVPAARQTVWEAFLDPAKLKKAIPGCEKLEAVAPDEYKATMNVRVGGGKGTFERKVKITQDRPPAAHN